VVSEHHLFEDDYLCAPLTFAAAVAARTQRIRLGTAILIAPLHHPAEIAEQCAVVDLVSETGALETAAGALGTDQVCVDSLSTTIVAPGRVGPFVAVPVSVAASGDIAGCRVQLRDNGRDARVMAVTVLKVRRVSRPKSQ
jgi:hypothetical protein